MPPSVDPAPVDLTPHIGTSSGDFFQTDEQLALEKRRAAKSIKYGKAGKPVQWPSKVLGMTATPSGGLAVAESAFTVRLCHPDEKLSTQRVLRGHTGPVTSVVMETDAAGALWAYSGSWDKSLRRWNTGTGQCAWSTAEHTDFVKCLCLRGHVLFSGCADGGIGVWNAETGKMLRLLKGHRRAVESIVVDAEGTFMYSAGSDASIRKWELTIRQDDGVLSAEAQCVDIWEAHETGVYALLLDEEQEAIWSASADNTVRRWDLNTGCTDTVLTHPEWVKCMALAGPYMITGCRDEDIRVWDLSSEKVVATAVGHSDEVSALVYSDGIILSGSYDCTVRRWSLQELLCGKSQKPAPDSTDVTTDPSKKTAMTADEERELEDLMAEEEADE